MYKFWSQFEAVEIIGQLCAFPKEPIKNICKKDYLPDFQKRPSFSFETLLICKNLPFLFQLECHRTTDTSKTPCAEKSVFRSSILIVVYFDKDMSNTENTRKPIATTLGKFVPATLRNNINAAWHILKPWKLRSREAFANSSFWNCTNVLVVIVLQNMFYFIASKIESLHFVVLWSFYNTWLEWIFPVDGLLIISFPHRNT